MKLAGALLGIGGTLLLPPAAGAQQVVPPGNSAANQYTETYPTAGGNATTQDGKQRSPQEVLGAKNARRLEAEGPEGRAAAALAAETAPVRGGVHRGGAPGAGGDGGKAGAQGGSAAEPGGSSGLSEVLGQATGSSSSGQMGLLLPIVVLLTIAGSVAYLWRRGASAT